MDGCVPAVEHDDAEDTVASELCEEGVTKTPPSKGVSGEIEGVHEPQECRAGAGGVRCIPPAWPTENGSRSDVSGSASIQLLRRRGRKSRSLVERCKMLLRVCVSAAPGQRSPTFANPTSSAELVATLSVALPCCESCAASRVVWMGGGPGAPSSPADASAESWSSPSGRRWLEGSDLSITWENSALSSSDDPVLLAQDSRDGGDAIKLALDLARDSPKLPTRGASASSTA
mmetsp:Transcript_24720/g.54347  ORF Transcript_24720/g.54347 Transcript_24720/m.54347 type:complete len:231 (-) Transcript_24720:341-1033(-)